MKSNKKNSANNGFGALMDTHTNALKNNSDEIVEILEALSEKSLQVKDRSNLKKLNKELKDIDKRIDLLGRATSDIEDTQESIGDDWFDF